MNDYKLLREEFEREIEILNEKEGAGRGVGLQAGTLMKNMWEDAMRFVNYDVLNRPTHHRRGVLEKYDFNNFYTLDIRIPTELLYNAFNSKKGKDQYKNVFNEVYRRDNLERWMVLQLRDSFIGALRDSRLKDAMKDYIRRLIIKKKPKKILTDSTKFNIFDLLHESLLGEAISEMDIDLGNQVIIHNKIKKGSELKYTTSKGNVVDVIVTDLPENLGGNVVPGYIQIRMALDRPVPPIAVPIVVNGETYFDVDIPKMKRGNIKISEYEYFDHPIWKQGLNEVLKNPVIGSGLRQLYEGLPTISFFSGPEGNGEELVIKNDLQEFTNLGFVEYVVDALMSASRGAVAQGVTIEELLEGRFSTKPISPDQSAFINRIQDPTSKKPISFRSQNDATLRRLHAYIIEVFKNDSLNEIIPTLKGTTKVYSKVTPSVKRKDLVLYMKQKDFQQFEKGGKGIGTIVKGIAKTLWKTAPTVNY